MRNGARRRTACVILNPTSGGGAAARLRPEIERELSRRDVEFEIVTTAGPGHAVELAARAARSGADYVVAAGGDGTAHEVANGLLTVSGEQVALGVLPIGTGNDFVKAVPGLTPRRTAYDTIAAGVVEHVDVGIASWDAHTEYFINGMGTGIDVEVVRGIERRRHLPGAFVYLSALCSALRRFQPIRLRATLDGLILERRALMIAACNGRCIGGVFLLCPDARLDDGLLDVCIVDALGPGRIVRALPRVLRGTHTDLPGVSMARAREIGIDVLDGPPLFFQLDGELRRADEPRLRVTLQAGTLGVAMARDRRAAAHTNDDGTESRRRALEKNA